MQNHHFDCQIIELNGSKWVIFHSKLYQKQTTHQAPVTWTPGPVQTGVWWITIVVIMFSLKFKKHIMYLYIYVYIYLYLYLYTYVLGSLYFVNLEAPNMFYYLWFWILIDDSPWQFPIIPKVACDMNIPTWSHSFLEDYECGWVEGLTRRWACRVGRRWDGRKLLNLQHSGIVLVQRGSVACFLAVSGIPATPEPFVFHAFSAKLL